MSRCRRCPTTFQSAAAGSGQPGGDLPDGDVGDYLRWNGTIWVPSDLTMPLVAGEADLGSALTIDAANSTEFQPLFQRELILSFGAFQITPTGIWLFPWNFSSSAGSTFGTVTSIIPSMAGRVRDMRILHATPVASADNILYTLTIGGIDTALTATLNTGGTSATNLIDVVNVTAIDRLNVKAQGATATRVIRNAVQFTLEY